MTRGPPKPPGGCSRPSVPELPAGYLAPLPEHRPAGLRRRSVAAGTEIWRLDASHPAQWGWDGKASTTVRCLPRSRSATTALRCTRRRARLASFLAATGDRSTIGDPLGGPRVSNTTRTGVNSTG